MVPLKSSVYDRFESIKFNCVLLLNEIIGTKFIQIWIQIKESFIANKLPNIELWNSFFIYVFKMQIKVLFVLLNL